MLVSPANATDQKRAKRASPENNLALPSSESGCWADWQCFNAAMGIFLQALRNFSRILRTPLC
jgi:hypothetical protein